MRKYAGGPTGSQVPEAPGSPSPVVHCRMRGTSGNLSGPLPQPVSPQPTGMRQNSLPMANQVWALGCWGPSGPRFHVQFFDNFCKVSGLNGGTNFRNDLKTGGSVEEFGREAPFRPFARHPLVPRECRHWCCGFGVPPSLAIFVEALYCMMRQLCRLWRWCQRR